MKGSILNDGYNYYKEDHDFEQTAKEVAIKSRSKDLFGVGGFISGGIVTVNGGDPDKIDISSAIGYDANGERFSFPTQTGVTIPDLLGGDNYVLVSYQNYTDTPKADPVLGVNNDTRTQETYNIEVKATYTPGDVDVYGNPYVPIALVVKSGSLSIDQTLRVDLLNLKPDVVDTEQLKDKAVTHPKLADYLKRIIWAPEEPAFFYDIETAEFKAKNTPVTFTVQGIAGTLQIAGLPLAVARPSLTGIPMVIQGDVSGVTCTLSAVSYLSFDWSAILKTSVLVFGYINEDDSFVNLQASFPDEIVLMSEDEKGTSGKRIKMHENLWRRGNETFRSYTPPKSDGLVSNSTAMQVTLVGATFRVLPGVSYVAGRRFMLTDFVDLSASNTNGYPILGSDQVYVWMHRNPVGGKRFTVQLVGAVAPANSYLLARVEFDGFGVPSAVHEDKRKFTPIEQIDVIESAVEFVQIGAELRWKSDTEVIVSPGIIGFPGKDGVPVIRRNLSPKTVTFGTPFQSENVSQDWPDGQLDTGGSPADYRTYAVFAIAEHEGDEFNVVATEIPYFPTVEKLGPNNYRIHGGSTAGLFVGQRIRVASQHASNQNSKFNNETEFSGVDVNGNEGEVVTNIAGSDITTSGQGPSAAFSPPTGGNIVVLDHIRPRGDLTGIDTQFRFLGAFITAPSGNKIRRFIQSADWVEFTRDNENGVGQFQTQGDTAIRDMRHYVPPMADRGKFTINFWARANGGNGYDAAYAPYARLSRRVGDITHTAGHQYFYVRGNSDVIAYFSLFGLNFNDINGNVNDFEMGMFLGTIVSDCNANGGNHVQYYALIRGYRIDNKREWALQPFSAIP